MDDDKLCPKCGFEFEPKIKLEPIVLMKKPYIMKIKTCNKCNATLEKDMKLV